MSNGKGSHVRCKECGYKIRGTNHEEGGHHIEGAKRGRGTDRQKKVKK